MWYYNYSKRKEIITHWFFILFIFLIFLFYVLWGYIFYLIFCCHLLIYYINNNYYKINNSELKLIESVFQNKDRNPATPKQYYHSTIAAFDSNAMAVSDSEADNIKRKYLRLEYTFTYFNN